MCQFCQLQLNVFFEFKKKVFLNHEKFTTILNKTKDVVKPKVKGKAAPLCRKSPPKNPLEDNNINKRYTRSSVKVEKTSNVIDVFESGELTLSHESKSTPKKSTLDNEMKRLHDDDENDHPEIKYIKLEADTLDDDLSNLFREDPSDPDETEHYLEEQYLENYSEIDENTEVEYVFEDEVDDENCNSFKEEFLKGEDTETGRNVKKVRKPKTPKVKKFVTERVLDADTMKEYDAVKCLNCSEYFETMDKFTAHQ